MIRVFVPGPANALCRIALLACLSACAALETPRYRFAPEAAEKCEAPVEAQLALLGGFVDEDTRCLFIEPGGSLPGLAEAARRKFPGVRVEAGADTGESDCPAVYSEREIWVGQSHVKLLAHSMDERSELDFECVNGSWSAAGITSWVAEAIPQ